MKNLVKTQNPQNARVSFHIESDLAAIFLTCVNSVNVLNRNRGIGGG